MSIQTQAHKFGATILQNLPEVPEDVMQDWIQRPKELQKFLAGLNANGSTAELKIWKQIKLGTGIKDADGMYNAIEAADMRVSPWAKDILFAKTADKKPVFTVADKEVEVSLATATVKELTGKNETMLQKIFDAIERKGGHLLPLEASPQLRLQYKDQPMGEWLVMATKSITGSDGCLRVFGVRRYGDGLWLRSGVACPGGLWDGGIRFVFGVSPASIKKALGILKS